ncbi:MAG: hypothetical protein QF553_04335 [Alphaproteobacteria bacterium]|nr:hypothetical protein [Alphaproteobacteria bacterium]
MTPSPYARSRAVGQASWEVASWAANPMKGASPHLAAAKLRD